MKRVHGSYMSEQEAIRAVEDLKAEGYLKEQIRVVSIKDCAGDCNKDLKVDEIDREKLKDNRSLWEKFKDIYTYSDYKTDYWNTYVEEDDVLRTYKSNLENGEILVLVDAEKIK